MIINDNALVNVSVHRRASKKPNIDRGIYIKHFKNIPMADLELVLVC